MSFGIQSVSSGSIALSLLSAQNLSSNTLQNPFDDPNGPFSNLNLTTDQQNQIDDIFSNAKSEGLSPAQVRSQVNSVLTSSQQQTLQSDVQSAQGLHHHHGSDGSNSESLLSQLDLTSDQETQIGQLVQGAQQNGTSSSDLLSQIDNVLTDTQQTQLANLLASGNTSYLVNTAA